MLQIRKIGELMGISEIIGKSSTLVACAALGLTLAGCGGTAATGGSGSTPVKAAAAKTVKKSNKKSSKKSDSGDDQQKAGETRGESKPSGSDKKKAESTEAKETKKASAKKSGSASKPSGSSKPSSNSSNKTDSGSSKPSGGNQNQNQGSGNSGSGSGNQGSDSGNQGSSKPAEPERVWAVVKPAWDEQVYHPAVTHTETQKQKVGVQYRATDGTLFDDEDACADYCAENSLWYSCLPKYQDITTTIVDQEAWTETIHHDAVWGWVNK